MNFEKMCFLFLSVMVFLTMATCPVSVFAEGKSAKQTLSVPAQVGYGDNTAPKVDANHRQELKQLRGMYWRLNKEVQQLKKAQKLIEDGQKEQADAQTGSGRRHGKKKEEEGTDLAGGKKLGEIDQAVMDLQKDMDVVVSKLENLLTDNCVAVQWNIHQDGQIDANSEAIEGMIGLAPTFLVGGAHSGLLFGPAAALRLGLFQLTAGMLFDGEVMAGWTANGAVDLLGGAGVIRLPIGISVVSTTMDPEGNRDVTVGGKVGVQGFPAGNGFFIGAEAFFGPKWKKPQEGGDLEQGLGYGALGSIGYEWDVVRDVPRPERTAAFQSLQQETLDRFASQCRKKLRLADLVGETWPDGVMEEEAGGVP